MSGYHTLVKRRKIMSIKRLFLFSTVFILLSISFSHGKPHDTTANLSKTEKEMEKKEGVFDLQEVVVTATKSHHILKDAPVSTSVITKREILAAGIQTTADAIRWAPGMNISGGAPFGASRRLTGLLQGLPAQYSLVLVDGKRTKSEHIHTGSNMNLIPIEMVERIEVVKGPASALYGSDAFGGVINIITNPIPKRPSFATNVSSGSFSTQNLAFSHGGRFGKVGYLLSAKLSDTDGVEGNWYKQKNALAKTAYALTEKDTLNLNAKYYQNNYLRSNKEVEDDRIDLSLDWNRDIAENSKIKAGGSFCRFTGSRKEATNITAQADIVYQGLLLPKHLVTSGLEARYEEFERVATARESESIPSFYIQDEIEVIKPLTFALALRLDSHPKAGAVLTPKASTLFKITENTSLRGSIGRGFRAPSLQDLYEYHYNHKTYWRDGNPNLKPEYSTTYNLGVEHQFKKSLLGRLSVFRNDFSDMIAVVDTGKEEDSLPVLQRENIKTAHTQGAEVEMRCKIADLTAMIAYTFLSTEDDEGKVLSYNPKHSTTLRLMYDVKKIGLTLYLSAEDIRERFYKDKGGENQELEDYSLLSFNITQRLIKDINIFFTVGNILDQKFETYEEGVAEASFGRTFTLGTRLNF